MCHGNHLQRDGGKWEESVAESFDTGTHNSNKVSCLWLISWQKLEWCIKIEIQMNSLCWMSEKIMHYEAFTTYNEVFNTYDMREKRTWLLQPVTKVNITVAQLPMPATIQTIHPKQAATPAATCDSKKLNTKLHWKHTMEWMMQLQHPKV